MIYLIAQSSHIKSCFRFILVQWLKTIAAYMTKLQYKHEHTKAKMRLNLNISFGLFGMAFYWFLPGLVIKNARTLSHTPIHNWIKNFQFRHIYEKNRNLPIDNNVNQNLTNYNLKMEKNDFGKNGWKNRHTKNQIGYVKCSKIWT